ncbi:MAG: cyclophane-forming radical SAM/SPASM peptide maturase GrrM/OscB [Rubrivivax sp.]|nr:cyclophane-forming radical SAM/SPASM peptide maturase GrrM/OscB [Rubrivivax sp.]
MEQVEQLGQQVIGVVPRAAATGSVRAGDFTPRLCTRLLVLQPTPFCNIDCSYCYLPQRDDRSRMSLATVRRAAEHLQADGLAGAELTVVWHAGEPLVLPPAWYAEAFAVVAEALPGVAVTHAMQSNATLIDDAWCRFFQQHGVAVGVSVDGPAALHDAHRRTRRGGGTHAQVLHGMARLRAHGVPFHAIAVVGAATLADADGFYDWFAAQGVSELGCNFDEAEGAHTASSLQGHEAAHAAFLNRLLQRSLQGPVTVRELAAAWRALSTPLPRWHWRQSSAPENTQVQPLALVTVGHDGRFGTFSPELLGQPAAGWDGFALGNVHEGGYDDALQRPAFLRQWQAVQQGLAACAARCAFFDVCGGGAPVNKFYEHGSFGAAETLHCRSMVQRPFDAVLRFAETALGQAA